MKLLFQFSGEHPGLPKAELLAVLEGEHLDYRIHDFQKKSRLMLVEIEKRTASFINRLALTKKSAIYVGASKTAEGAAQLLEKVLKKNKTFRVRGYSNSLDVELGGLLHEKGFVVDLHKPDVEVSTFELDGITVGINLPLKKNFEERKPQFRPYFHPTSMHPKIARVLVNLARVKKGDVVLDPFCGTGGILIEAGLIGCKMIGQDISNEMVEGCKRNIEFYGLMGRIKKSDTLKEKLPQADAIVTDPPYGRSSYSSDDVLLLYNNFIKKSHESVRKNGFAVIVVPNSIKPKLGRFKLIEKFDLRVHKSLTRRILVLRKR